MEKVKEEKNISKYVIKSRPGLATAAQPNNYRAPLAQALP
jgi:hypothetical protein